MLSFACPVPPKQINLLETRHMRISGDSPRICILHISNELICMYCNYFLYCKCSKFIKKSVLLEADFSVLSLKQLTLLSAKGIDLNEPHAPWVSIRICVPCWYMYHFDLCSSRGGCFHCMQSLLSSLPSFWMHCVERVFTIILTQCCQTEA